MTPFRQRVLSVFQNSTNAISMAQLENELEDFDRITLYRTIKLFIQEGLIHEIVMPGDIRKLALCNDRCLDKNHVHQHNHLHFRCEICDEVFCLSLGDFPKIKFPKFKIKQLEIQGIGICSACN